MKEKREKDKSLKKVQKMNYFFFSSYFNFSHTSLGSSITGGADFISVLEREAVDLFSDFRLELSRNENEKQKKKPLSYVLAR